MALVPTSFAEVVTVSKTWTTPDVYIDGSFLSPSEIKQYQVFYTIDADINYESDPIVTTDNTLSWTLDLDKKPEPYTIQVAVKVELSSGETSDPSNLITQQFIVTDEPLQPMPPTDPGIKITCPDGCIIEILN